MAAIPTQDRYPQLHDREWLRAQIGAGSNAADIARLVGCTDQCARDALERNGVHLQRTCRVCGERFEYRTYRSHIRQCKRPRIQARTAVCPHCKKDFAPATVTEHAERCFHNPVVYAATRALLDDGNGVILQRQEYIKRRSAQRAGTRAMTRQLLSQEFGSWTAVADAFGLLTSVDAADVALRNEIDRERAAVELERRILESEQHRGLPVCRVRETPTEVHYVLR